MAPRLCFTKSNSCENHFIVGPCDLNSKNRESCCYFFSAGTKDCQTSSVLGLTVFQVGADLLVRAWPIEKQGIVMLFRKPAASTVVDTDRSTKQQPRTPALSPPKLSIEDIMGDVVAALGSAALLAWLLSKPIRSLQSAIADAANGNLDVRIADRMGPGNDELKDLGV
jgi:methyl-accepting chemotaxis protein